MALEAFLGLDIGGTGVKAGVFRPDGEMLAFSRHAFDPTVSADGHVDIAIESVYESARAAVRETIGTSRAKIMAMSVSSQGETFVTLDKSDRPLHDAILWYDSRAVRQAEELCDTLQAATGRVASIDAIMTVSKIWWLRENRPDIIRQAARFLLLPDYIAYRLSGIPAIDTNTASSTGMLTPDERQYDSFVLQMAEVDLDQLSTIFVPGTPIAKISRKAAEDWGLTPDTLLVAGTNDQYAGALGAGNCRPGILSETSGTCLAIVTLMEAFDRAAPPGLFVGRFPIARYRFAMAYSKTAGLVLDWFRREFCGNAEFEELNREAAKTPIGCRGVSMLPHFDGMISPKPNPQVRGIFANLTLRHTRADLYRAILEALSFCLYENIQFLQEMGCSFNTIRSIGGGAKNDFWLQMKADVTGLPVEKPVVTEAAVLGAAMLAAEGQGVFRSLEESSASLYRAGQVFTPDDARHRAYREPYQRYQALK